MFKLKTQSDERIRKELVDLSARPWNTLCPWERGLITRLITECKRRGIDYVSVIATADEDRAAQ